jgi:CheY-like chemotaxis protein
MARRRRHSKPAPGDHSDADRKKAQLEALQKRLNTNARRMSKDPVEDRSPQAFYRADGLRFVRPASLQSATLEPDVSEAVEQFRSAVRDRQSTVIFNWPNRLPGVAALHGLSVLCELAEGPDRFAGLTTLFYPASARTGGNQKSLLIDREWLLETNRPWLDATFKSLRQTEKDDDYVRARYHAILSLMSELRPNALEQFKRGQAVVERTRDRGHPTLHEIIARRSIKPNGQLVGPEQAFLDRCRRLSRLLMGKGGAEDWQRIEAVDQALTPWLISTLHGASAPGSWIAYSAPSKRKPDVLLIDLQYPARARLGETWRANVVNAVARLRHGDTDLPVIAVTDDPFVAQFARYELSPQAKKGRRTNPLPIRFNHQTALGLIFDGPVNNDALATVEAPELVVDVFASDLAKFAADALKLRTDTIKIADGKVARAISVCLSKLRAMANAPYSQSELGALFTATGDTGAERRILEAYNITGALADLRSAAPQADRYEAAVEALAERAGELARGLSRSARETIGKDLMNRLRALPKRATRTLVIAQSRAAARALETWIENDPSLEPVLEKLGQKFDISAPQRAAAEIAVAAASTRPFGHLLLLSPPPQVCLAVFAGDQCPKKVELLCDASSGKFLADYGAAVLKLAPKTAPPHARISHMITRVRSALDRNVASLPQFDLGDSVRAAGVVTDLTGRSYSGGSEVLRLLSVEGEDIRVTPETQLVARKRASLDMFEFLLGKSVTAGREVLVPRPAFIDAIASAKSFRAAAVPLLSDYHELVRQRAAQLPGASLRQKAERLHPEFGQTASDRPTVSSVKRWIDIDRQGDIPVELRIPQAPRTYAHFAALMNVLKVDKALGDVYWHYGILATRSTRIRSGFQMRRLYTAALVDPDALRRDNPAAGDLIEFIHDLSSEYFTEIAEVALAQEDVQ